MNQNKFEEMCYQKNLERNKKKLENYKKKKKRKYTKER